MSYYSYECNWYDEDYRQYFDKGIVCAEGYAKAMEKICDAYEDIIDVKIFWKTDDPVYEIND